MPISPRTRKNLIYLTLFLAIIGFLTSGYLIRNHYVPTSSFSFCDLSPTVSCSVVNSSKFSLFWNVPVAVFGAVWFVVLFALIYHILKKEKGCISNSSLLLALLIWNIVGLFSVTYLVIAEIILQTLCPFCTLIHVIIIATLIISVLLYFGTSRITLREAIPELKSWAIAVIIITTLPLLLFNLAVEKQEDYTSLAKCLNEKNVVMYSSSRSAICAKTRAMFGQAFTYIKEVECSPGKENSQTELCQQKGINVMPTWVIDRNNTKLDDAKQNKTELKRHEGFLSLEELKAFSGCKESRKMIK